jgi:hypothetical protein
MKVQGLYTFLHQNELILSTVIAKSIVCLGVFCPFNMETEGRGEDGNRTN